MTVEKMLENIKKEIRELTRTEHIEPTYLDFVECDILTINKIINDEYDKFKKEG